MIDLDYQRDLERAAAAFNYTVGMAADLFGHGSREHCEAIDRARAEHGNAVEAATRRQSIRISGRAA